MFKVAAGRIEGPHWAAWGRFLVFTLGVVVLDGLVGISRFFGNVAELAGKNIVLTAIYIGILVFLTGAGLLLLRARSRWILGLVLGIFILSTLLEVQYLRVNDRGFEPALVGTAITEISFLDDAVTSFVDARTIFLLVIAVIFWLGCAWALRRVSIFGPLLSRRSVTVLSLVLVAVSLGHYARFQSFRLYPTPLRTMHNVVNFFVQKACMAERTDVEVKVVDRPVVAPRLVLLVDESVRPDQLGLGGPLDTTPYLRSIRKRLLDFGTAASGSTCSHASNVLLNSFVRPADVASRKAIEQAQTIFYYAKRAGWRTALLMGQYRSPLHNGLREGDLQHIDEVVIANNLERGPAYRNDYLLVEKLEGLYAKYPNEKLFVYVLKLGCHFPYDNCYPAAEAVYKPVLGRKALASQNIERVMNSYHNSLRYAVDGFYRELHRRLDRFDALYIYTSDHGQVFNFEGIGLTHCGTDRMMAAVPLWIDGGGAALDRLRERYGHDFAKRNTNHASHFNIFPTLLTLMNVETDEPTLFDDLSGQKRIYCPPGGAFTYQRFAFDAE